VSLLVPAFIKIVGANLVADIVDDAITVKDLLRVRDNTVDKFNINKDGEVGMVATNKLFLDGTDTTGDTYIHEQSDDDVEIILADEIGLKLEEIGTEINVVPGAHNALATTTTDGFLYIPSMAGVPTGNSTDYTGKFPIVWDSTGSNLYLNTTGTTWLNLTAGAGDNLGNHTATTDLLMSANDIDMGTLGARIDLDTDNDTSIRAIADDQIVLEAGGRDALTLAQPTATLFWIPQDTGNSTMEIRSGAGISRLRLSRANTGIDAPTVVAGNQLAQYQAAGWDGSTYAVGGLVIMSSTETWSGTARGTSMSFQTTPNTTTTNTQGMLLDQDSILKLDVGLDMTVTANRIDLDTDNDTSIRASVDDRIMFETGAVDEFAFENSHILTIGVSATPATSGKVRMPTGAGLSWRSTGNDRNWTFSNSSNTFKFSTDVADTTRPDIELIRDISTNNNSLGFFSWRGDEVGGTGRIYASFYSIYSPCEIINRIYTKGYIICVTCITPS